MSMSFMYANKEDNDLIMVGMFTYIMQAGDVEFVRKKKTYSHW
jgi:hypothetical protein